ncbi:MAG: HNH endonuclease, partial [Candidatus Sumerlaeia bacterium]|nr:HNH endonuclease [Candidatus Sumerlaeia bacterium]
PPVLMKTPKPKRLPIPLVDYLESFCEKQDDGCWNWCAAMDKSGPRITIECLRENEFSVPRLMYILTTGLVKKNEEVSQSCGNRRCVNPRHLQVMGPAPYSTRRPPTREQMRDVWLSRRNQRYAAACNQQFKRGAKERFELAKEMIEHNVPRVEIAATLGVSMRRVRRIIENLRGGKECPNPRSRSAKNAKRESHLIRSPTCNAGTTGCEESAAALTVSAATQSGSSETENF